MDKIPFSLYDFFGYLAPGFLILVAADYAATGGTHIYPAPGPVMAIFWTLTAYVAGHVIANISGLLFEGFLVKKVLRTPEENLLQSSEDNAARHKRTVAEILFPGYYEPLPRGLAARVRRQAERRGATDSRSTFSHCRAAVRKDPAVRATLDTFLNLYGFCRNVSMSSLLATGLLTWGLIRRHSEQGGWSTEILLWIIAATATSVGMLYRYLKFFKKYTKEVLVSYVECETNATKNL
jgi:hypothetical protein